MQGLHMALLYFRSLIYIRMYTYANRELIIEYHTRESLNFAKWAETDYNKQRKTERKNFC